VKPRVLIVTDSMGSDYGATGYPNVAKARLDASIEVLTYAGVAIFYVAQDLIENQALGRYDVAVVQLGVPDVISRFPLWIMRGLRKTGLTFVRESFFFTPPTFSAQWILKLPLLLIRLVTTRIYRKTFTSSEELVAIHGDIVAKLREHANRVVVLPVFEVSRIYGPDHTRRAREANEKLAAAYGSDYLRCPALEPAVYGRFRNRDFFHLRDEYHQLLAAELEPILMGSERSGR
jgi:hypothetical protein